MIAAIMVMLVLIFPVRFKLPSPNLEPSAALAALAHALRAPTFDVSEKRDFVSIRIDSLASVKLRAHPGRSETVLSYQAHATPGGWAIIVSITLLFATLAVLPSLFVLHKTLLFVEDRILPTLDQLPAIANQSMDTRALPVQSLSEDHRMAFEAYEVQESNYHDKIIIASNLGLFVFLGLVVGVMLVSDVEESPGDSFLSVLVTCATVAFGFVFVSVLHLHRHARPRILKLRSQVSEFEAALAREASSSAPLHGPPSSFELVAEAWQQLPAWLDSRRRAGVFREPGILLFIFLLVYTGGLALAFAAISIVERLEPLNMALSLGIAMLLILSAFGLRARWRRSHVEEAASLEAKWMSRTESMQAEMERVLRG